MECDKTNFPQSISFSLFFQHNFLKLLISFKICNIILSYRHHFNGGTKSRMTKAEIQKMRKNKSDYHVFGVDRGGLIIVNHFIVIYQCSSSTDNNNNNNNPGTALNETKNCHWVCLVVPTTTTTTTSSRSRKDKERNYDSSQVHCESRLVTLPVSKNHVGVENVLKTMSQMIFHSKLKLHQKHEYSQEMPITVTSNSFKQV